MTQPNYKLSVKIENRNGEDTAQEDARVTIEDALNQTTVNHSEFSILTIETVNRPSFSNQSTQWTFSVAVQIPEYIADELTSVVNDAEQVSELAKVS